MQLKQTMAALALVATLAACHNNGEVRQHDTSHYDVITEKSYLVRESKPASNPGTDSVAARQQAFMTYLESKGFKRHLIQKDSILFRRENSLEVEMILTPPTDTWDMHTIIAFDPAKNPFFVNLHRDSSQLVRYVEGPRPDSTAK